MKLIYITPLFLIFVFSPFSYPQRISAGPPPYQEKPMGGINLPDKGNVNVLFVFAQFPDDSYDPGNAEWPKGKAPSKLNTWVDKTWSSDATPFSMTDYFNTMSLNKFHLTGKCVSVITEHPRDWYASKNLTRYDIHKEILQNQLDPKMDFAEFDNWSGGNYKLQNSPDGIIDLIIFIWRNVDMDFQADQKGKISNKLSFGWFGDLGFGAKYTVDNGKETVLSNHGATITNYFFKDPFRFTIHEIGHYLLGGNEYHNGHGFWAMESGYEVRSYMINAYERYRLKWIDSTQLIRLTPKDKPVTIDLPDFITTGKAVRIQIPDKPDQFFYLENHQKISRWDKCSPDSTPDDKGIFVIRQDYRNSPDGMSATWMKLIPAEGRYDWIIAQWVTNKWGAGYLPVFKQGKPDRDSGYTPYEFIPGAYPEKGARGTYEIIFQETAGNGYSNQVTRGGRGHDAFRIGYKKEFNSDTNPNSQDKDRHKTGIGFKINSLKGTTYNITVYPSGK
jgi:M6 family metalloprotease-like protein